MLGSVKGAWVAAIAVLLAAVVLAIAVQDQPRDIPGRCLDEVARFGPVSPDCQPYFSTEPPVDRQLGLRIVVLALGVAGASGFLTVGRVQARERANEESAKQLSEVPSK